MTAVTRGSSGRIRDVARLAGVSVGTVSNYFNHPERVAPGAMARVEAAVNELGYVRNAAARQLRLGESTSVGLVLLDVGNPFFTDIARAAEDTAAEHGLTVILGNSDENASREASYIDLFEKQRVRGVLVSPIGDVTARLIELRRHGIESVLVDRRSPNGEIASVSVDDAAGGYRVAKHLLDAGRRRIVYLTGSVSVLQSEERYAGAERAVAEVPGATIRSVHLSSASVFEGRAFGASIHSMPADSRPDAVFAVNDVVALGVLQAFIGDGELCVPRDLSIVGYDDIDFASSAFIPLTSVRQPSRMLGTKAVELMIERLEHPDRPPRQITFEPELVVRESSQTQREIQT